MSTFEVAESRRAQGARDRDQPRRQGRQGRPAVLVHGARRRSATRSTASASATGRRARSRSPSRRPSTTRRRTSSPCRSTAPRSRTRSSAGSTRPRVLPAPGRAREPASSPAAASAPCSSSPASATCSRRASARRTRSTWRRPRSTGSSDLRAPEDVATAARQDDRRVLPLPRAVRRRAGVAACRRCRRGAAASRPSLADHRRR